MRTLTTLFILISFFANAELKWEQKANFRGSGRHRGTGFAIKDKGYIGLGHINSVVNIPFADIWEYDPASDTWSQKADYPTGGNYGASTFTIGDKAYVGNGVYSNGEWQEFDPVSNKWRQIADCPNTQSEKTGFSIGDKGYFISSDNLFEYDPSSDMWIEKATPVFNTTSWISSFAIDDKGYVYDDGNLMEYKQSTDSWSIRASSPGIATGGSGAFSINKKGYIVAGYGNWLSDIVSEVWEFNPGSNEWKQVVDFPGASRRFLVGFSIGNFGYIGTGTNGVNFNDFYQFGEVKSFYSNINVNDELEVVVYPNPTSFYLSIDLPKTTKEYIISIYDLNGKIVLEKELYESTKIDVSGFEPASYFYRVKEEGIVIKSDKIIIH